MRWKQQLLSLFVVCLILSGTRSVVAQSAENAIIAQVNQFRASLGLPAFTYNPKLAVAAAQQAQFIADNNTYTHTGTGGSTPQTRANAAGYNGRASENIVGGSNMTPAQALAWWKNSPPHYNTITSDYYTE
ncbi:MAG TPA: CAP domain-containing protein, partial [Anaerolineae bacterium]|nr:CAP domain-containing protein [Anaerolineae bacterium]